MLHMYASWLNVQFYQMRCAFGQMRNLPNAPYTVSQYNAGFRLSLVEQLNQWCANSYANATAIIVMVPARHSEGPP